MFAHNLRKLSNLLVILLIAPSLMVGQLFSGCDSDSLDTIFFDLCLLLDFPLLDFPLSPMSNFFTTFRIGLIITRDQLKDLVKNGNSGGGSGIGTKVVSGQKLDTTEKMVHHMPIGKLGNITSVVGWTFHLIQSHQTALPQVKPTRNASPQF